MNFRAYTKLQARRSRPQEYPQTHQAVNEDLAFVFRHVRLPQGSRVLDMGTRDAYGVEKLDQMGLDAVGIELVESVARYARRQGRNVLSMDMHNLEFLNASFDLIISRHSLEHTLNYRQVLAECARVLKDGGFVYFVIPVEYGQAHELHTQPFCSPEQLPETLQELGFEVVVREVIPSRGNPAIDLEQRVIARKPQGMPIPKVPPTVLPEPHHSAVQNGLLYVKTVVKRLHGWLYRLLLPALVRPPGAMRNGRFYTMPRLGIMQFLETWRDRIHGDVLDVGVGTWTYPRQLLQDVCHYTTVDCFEHPNVDVVSDIHSLADAFAPNSFDFVLLTDVLEHVQRPWVAVRQMYVVLKPGGTLLLTTPFNFHLHGNDVVGDYWRLSADGLRYLLVEEAGFQEVQVTAIGHPEFPFSHVVVARK